MPQKLWPMSYKWKCYLKVLGDFLKGRVLALLWLFLHTTACNEQALAGTTAINLDHEDEDHTLRLEVVVLTTPWDYHSKPTHPISGRL